MDRIGYPDSPVIYQGAAPHGDKPVGLAEHGDPSAKHGRVGCANVAVTMAIRHLGVRAGAMVLDVAQAARARGAMVYPLPRNPAAAVMTELVKSQRGLRVGVDTGVGRAETVEVLRPLIVDTLKTGGVLLVCVDYDRHTPKGDPTGEHWGCAYAADAERVWLADPATARKEWLPLSTLARPVMWGRERRPYLAVRALAVFRE